MNGIRAFRINGKLVEMPIFEKGDRVGLKNKRTLSINATGTVDGTKDNGLFVEIVWDNKSFISKDGGNVELGRLWMVDSVKLIDD